VVFALIGCLLVAVSIGQLARRLPSAGGFCTYASRGLHPAVGFLVGWGYAFVDATVGFRSPVVPAQVGRGAR
jgi:amino acid transporter